MNKQIVQEIINASNKDIDSVPVNYTVDGKYNRYYDDNQHYYKDNHHYDYN